jgi:hypothetical protein
MNQWCYRPDSENWRVQRRICPVPLCLPNISHEVAWNRTERSAVKWRPQKCSCNRTDANNKWGRDECLTLSTARVTEALKSSSSWSVQDSYIKATSSHYDLKSNMWQTFLGSSSVSFIFLSSYCFVSLHSIFTPVDFVDAANLSSYNTIKFSRSYWIYSGPGSSVGIATDYGLDGPGGRIPVGRDIPHLSRPALGLTQPPVQWVPGLSRGQSTAGACCWPLTPF